MKKLSKKKIFKGKNMTKSISILLIVTLFITGCYKDKEETNKEPLTRPVKIVHIKESLNQKKYFEYPGVISPAQNTIMAFEVSGTINKFNFKVGDYINKGEVIAKLDKRDFISKASSSKTAMSTALKDFKRVEKLIEFGAISQRDYDNAKQKYETTKSSYEISKKALDDTTLIAEYSGIFAKKIVNDYARINAKEPILILQDNSMLEVKVDIPEKDIIKSKGNLKHINELINVEIFVTAINNKGYKGKVKEVATVADPITRTFELTLIMNNQKYETILPGMSATVRISEKKSKSNVIYLNSSSVRSDDKHNFYVWVVNKDSKVERRKVIVGEFIGSELHIKDGLNKDDRVVVTGVNKLHSGMKIKELK